MRDETAAGPVSCGTVGRVRRRRNVPFVDTTPGRCRERGGASPLPVCRWKPVVVMLAALAAAASPAASDDLRIATTGDHPPFSHVDAGTGKVGGLDVEVALALCAEMRAECEFVLYEWPRLILELRAGNADAIAASMSITEKRRAFVAFTAPYYANTVRFVARRGGGFDPTRLAGTKVGVMRATVSSDWLARNGGGASVRLFRDQAGLRRALSAETVDAIMGDGLGFHDWLQSPAGRPFGYVGAGLRLDEGTGMAVRREDRALLGRLNRALARILANGTYDRITRRYFPFSIRPDNESGSRPTR